MIRPRWVGLLDPDPLAAMIAAEHLLADTDFDDWADQAEAVAADEITARRLEHCIADHPAGRSR